MKVLCQAVDGICSQCGDVCEERTRQTCRVGPNKHLVKDGRRLPGLGDRAEVFFKKLGVKPCKGCKKRIRKLNKVSDWWRRWWG